MLKSIDHLNYTNLKKFHLCVGVSVFLREIAKSLAPRRLKFLRAYANVSPGAFETSNFKFLIISRVIKKTLIKIFSSYVREARSACTCADAL